MLKRLLASAAIIPLMWWTVAPNAVDGCDNGVALTVPYTTQQYLPDGSIVQVNGTFKYDQRVCKAVRDFPAPTKS